MHTTRTTILTAMFSAALGTLLVTASPLSANDARTPARHFDLVNATFDSVTALAIAPARGGAFHSIMLGQPLQGGLTSVTFDVPAGGCMRDLRVTFQGGRTQMFAGLDLCRTSGLRLLPYGSARATPVPP